MKNNEKKGMALPIVLCVIVCLGCYVISLSWSMANSRNRYDKTFKNKKAYFMARSAMEHMMLKIKTLQRHCSESMLTLENVPEDEKKIVYSIFTGDIVIPPDNDYKNNDRYEYRINDFNIKSVDLEKSALIVEIETIGKFGGYSNSIKRLIRISR